MKITEIRRKWASIVGLTGLLVGASAQAMPCDTGYVCAAKHFRVEIQTCRYVNRVSLLSVEIDGTPVVGATLGAAYDGKYAGHGPLAFEVDLPLAANEALHTLSFEIPAHLRWGWVKERVSEEEPQPAKTLRTEIAHCKIDE
jgi:hypothetical protein